MFAAGVECTASRNTSSEAVFTSLRTQSASQLISSMNAASAFPSG